MYNKMQKGEISELDYQKFHAISGMMPKQIEASYQNFERQLEANLKGDPYLNARNIDALMVAANGIKMGKNEKGITTITYNELDKATNKITKKTVTQDAFDGWVNSHQTSPKVENPMKAAVDFGLKFKSDIKKTAWATGTRSRSGIDTGETAMRFESAFTGQFGNRSDGNNPYVRVHMGADIPYEEAWDNLHNSAAAMIQNKDESTYRAPAKVKETTDSTNKALDKINTTLIEKDGKVVTNVESAGGEDVSGYGLSYKVPDTDQKLRLTGADLKDVPDAAVKNFEVNNVFVTEDGRMFVKGKLEKESIEEAALDKSVPKDERSRRIMDALKGNDRSKEWFEVDQSALSDVRANVFGGTKVNEIYNYADKKAGGGSPENKPKSTSGSKFNPDDIIDSF